MAVVDGAAPAWPADEWDSSWDTAPPWFPPVFADDGPDIELLDRLDELVGTLTTRSTDISAGDSASHQKAGKPCRTSVTPMVEAGSASDRSRPHPFG